MNDGEEYPTSADIRFVSPCDEFVGEKEVRFGQDNNSTFGQS